MAFMAKNRSLSYCKVVEVIAETIAPLTPMEELLARIPSQRDDGNVSKVNSFSSQGFYCMCFITSSSSKHLKSYKVCIRIVVFILPLLLPSLFFC